LKLQKIKADSENSWTVELADINTDTYDLSVKNPSKKDEAALREPQVILEEIKTLDEKTNEVLNSIMEMI